MFYSIFYTTLIIQLPSSGSYNGFHLYISPSAGYTLPITVTAVTTFYQFTGLDNGVIYNVTIAAYNAGGDGPSISNSKLTIGECEPMIILMEFIFH